MASELDKKLQKTQTDLVQSVLESFDKRNYDRVDMLISNAMKQLKMSRFKPDQSTCISLIYLARIRPEVFDQSNGTKELLKTHIKRDNAPANIKGTKNDIILPVLAANILLACCDSSDIKSIILHRIEQWLSPTNQRPAEMILHLLAVLCTKSNGDQKTVSTLVEMRQHWQQYFEGNFDLYGQMPTDICIGIRKLIHNETNPGALLENLKFLIQHDHDILGLSKELSKFIIGKPITVNSMLQNRNNGDQLKKMFLTIYNKLFEWLKNPLESGSENVKQVYSNKDSATPVILEPRESVIKMEHGSEQNHLEDKSIKLEPKVAAKLTKSDTKDESATKSGANDETTNQNGSKRDSSDTPPLYMRLPTTSQVVALDRVTIEAILTLLSSIDLEADNYTVDFKDLLDCWLVDLDNCNEAYICEDICMTTPHNISLELRSLLVHSKNDKLVVLGLHCASAGQLVELVQQFCLPISTIEKILQRLAEVIDVETLIVNRGENPFFDPLMEYYEEMGASGVSNICKRIVRT